MSCDALLIIQGSSKVCSVTDDNEHIHMRLKHDVQHQMQIFVGGESNDFSVASFMVLSLN